MILRALLLSLLVFATSACTHSLHVAHVSDFSPTFKTYAQGTLVKARAEQTVVLGFVTQTNYVNQAYNQLSAQCPKGQIQGITTQFSTSHGFFHWKNIIDMQGLCIN